MAYIEQNLDIFILIILTIIGLGMIGYNIYLISKGRQSNSWTSTNGIITKSELGILKFTGDSSLEYNYRADIEYKFTIDDQIISSKQAFFGDELYHGNKSRTTKLLSQFPIAKTVTVFYNPNDVQESVLIRGSSIHRFFNIILGLGIIIAGALIESNFEIVKAFVLEFNK